MKKSEVSVLELKRLLIEIKERDVSVLFRFRVLGELWTEYAQLLAVNERRIIISDEKSSTPRVIEIINIVQFEIEERYQNYLPNNHYSVVPIKKSEIVG